MPVDMHMQQLEETAKGLERGDGGDSDDKEEAGRPQEGLEVHPDLAGGFGAKMMKKMGWTEGKGLGVYEQGRADNVEAGEVRTKNLGLGAAEDMLGKTKKKPKSKEKAQQKQESLFSLINTLGVHKSAVDALFSSSSSSSSSPSPSVSSSTASKIQVTSTTRQKQITDLGQFTNAT